MAQEEIKGYGSVEHKFTNHPPRSEEVANTLDQITLQMIQMGQIIEASVPSGREQSLALTKLEECSMWCKAGIARLQDV